MFNRRELHAGLRAEYKKAVEHATPGEKRIQPTERGVAGSSNHFLPLSQQPKAELIRSEAALLILHNSIFDS